MPIDLDTALMVADDDLEDGAYFAIIADLTGMSPEEVMTALAAREKATPNTPKKGRTGKKSRGNSRQRRRRREQMATASAAAQPQPRVSPAQALALLQQASTSAKELITDEPITDPFKSLILPIVELRPGDEFLYGGELTRIVEAPHRAGHTHVALTIQTDPRQKRPVTVTLVRSSRVLVTYRTPEPEPEPLVQDITLDEFRV